MKLIFTPNPEYLHKVLIVAHECGVTDLLEFERSRPFAEDTSIWKYNPFGKVPCMIMDNGEPLFGGLQICEFLNSQSKNGVNLYPEGEARWTALRQMVLGDSMFDATTLLRLASWLPEEQKNRENMLRERRKIVNALDRMEFEAPQFRDAPFHIGHICMAGGISYLDLRNPIRDTKLEDGDADFDWRAGRPNLSAWYDEIRKRPSLQYSVQLPE